jgi:hypothetical protein
MFLPPAIFQPGWRSTGIPCGIHGQAATDELAVWLAAVQSGSDNVDDA